MGYKSLVMAFVVALLLFIMLVAGLNMFDAYKIRAAKELEGVHIMRAKSIVIGESKFRARQIMVDPPDFYGDMTHDLSTKRYMQVMNGYSNADVYYHAETTIILKYNVLSVESVIISNDWFP